MTKLLLDANISPETGTFLAEMFGFDVIDLITKKKSHLSDDEIVALAKQENRIIVTFDLDFGEIYHFKEKEKLGVIILRLENKTVESVNKTLSNFFKDEAKNIDLKKSLIVLDENRVRIY